jgi:hypothetical protein
MNTLVSKYTDNQNAAFKAAHDFLVKCVTKAKLKTFDVDTEFTYTETEVRKIDNMTYENVLFDHKKSGRDLCITILKGKVDCINIDKGSECLECDEPAADILKNPKKWFKEYWLPKKYSATASINYCIYVECEAYDEDEAREKLEEQAYETYQTADVDGVDAVIEDIDEV